MEVSSRSILINKNKQNVPNQQACLDNNQSQQSFKGAVDVLTVPCTKLVESMETRKIVEFCALDIVSTIAPRVYLGFKRNQEELGHPNYKVATEVALREFVTGPGMVLIPALFISTCGWLSGKAANLQFNTIDKLTNIFKGSAKNIKNAANPAEEFYEAALKKAFNGKNEISAENLKFIKDKLADITNKAKPRKAKKDAKKAIADKLIELNKKIGLENLKTPEEIDFGNGLKIKASKVSDALTAYAGDIIKKVKDKNDFSEDAIKKVVKTPVRGRAICIASALISTAVFLWYTPKIYQRSKEYPGLEGLNKPKNYEKKA